MGVELMKRRFFNFPLVAASRKRECARTLLFQGYVGAHSPEAKPRSVLFQFRAPSMQLFVALN
jgi:hypothetical protein